MRALGKRGDATEVPYFTIMVIFLAISFLVVIFVNSKMAYIVDNTVLNQSAAHASISEGINNITTTTAQRGFLILIAFMIITMMVTAFFVKEHPVFFIIYLVTTAFTILIAVVGQTLWDKLIINNTFAQIAAQQTILNFVMGRLIFIVLGAAAISIVITFSKLALPSINTGGTEDI